MLKEVKTKTLVSRKDSAVTNNLPSNWTGDEGEGEPLGTRVFCPHLLDGSSSLTLQLPMLKEVKTKTLVSRKDSGVTNNLPSNWKRDEGEGEPLGIRVFCPHLLHVMRMKGSVSLTLQLGMLKEVKMKTLVSRKDSAVTNNLPSNRTGDEGEGEPLGTRVFCPHLHDVRWMRGWGWQAQDEELKWKKKKSPSGVVDNEG
ncbi:hypothetical protein CDAR_583081 [Caerostris darwini]|uniref:Uncharacterized protein n=1 Tax=Caerostris darwini TaxID=1538125 RepID=A0AAV4WVS6_9ARAC|nr:hypothetical protein CDAR_583081 [Caerostris darwini]